MPENYVVHWCDVPEPNPCVGDAPMRHLSRRLCSRGTARIGDSGRHKSVPIGH